MGGRGLLAAAGLWALAGCAAPGEGPAPGVEQISVSAHSISCTEQTGGLFNGARNGGTAIGIGVDAEGGVSAQLGAAMPARGSGETARCTELLELAEKRAQAELEIAHAQLAQQRVELQLAQAKAKMEIAQIERGAAELEGIDW